jgi:hypothetical protein
VQHPRSFHASPPRTSCRDKGLAIPWMCSSPSHPRATRRRPRGGISPPVPKTTDWAEYRPLAFHGGSNLHFHYLRAATTRRERGSPRTKLRPGHLHQHAIAAGLRGVKTHIGLHQAASLGLVGGLFMAALGARLQIYTSRSFSPEYGPGKRLSDAPTLPGHGGILGRIWGPFDGDTFFCPLDDRRCQRTIEKYQYL